MLLWGLRPLLDVRVLTYSELAEFSTFNERFEYLKLDGSVGKSTFGFDRYINQQFYQSYEWQNIRNYVISRDNGCDLGIIGYEIYSDILVHHMNPIDAEAIIHRDEAILDPEFLITTTKKTHNAIHYGTDSLLPKVVEERAPGDTRLW